MHQEYEAAVVRARKGEHVKLLEDARKSGYVRVRIDGILYDLSEEIRLEKNKKHTIEIMVDRLVVKDGIQKRLTESIETVCALSAGDLRYPIDFFMIFCYTLFIDRMRQIRI